MLTDSELRSKVDQIWDRLWSSGLSNPMDSIEQFSYLPFLKRLDDAENQREKQAKPRNKPFEPQIKPELRWSHWINFKADEALKHVREKVALPHLLCQTSREALLGKDSYQATDFSA